ncbi:MAG: protein kinase, partial [Acidobacteria bacterium]|nr:protein kinase [Acidobacteriota bacterium]
IIDPGGNHQHLQRVLREAQAASALNHPHICTIYEVNDDGDTPFIAMEYVAGETLDKKIETGLEPNQTLEIALQIADALTEAHAHNIVHRDIKPANVIVTPRGRVKVLDFGLAKKISAESDDETQKIISQSGTIIGTASYMSPEQAKGQEVDERSDIFSFGVVLYEMTAGRPPFDGESTMDVIGSILHKEPAPLHRLMPEVSPDLERVINKALRKDREERYQTAKDLLVDLKEIKQELEFQNKLERTAPPNREKADTQMIGATTGHAERATSSAEYAISEIRKHKFASLVVLVFLLLAIGGSSFWYFNAHPSNTLQIESIAVLPFVNESGNAEVEYLTDGMTESLINSLSNLPNLSVQARSSVFHYKGLNVEPKKVATDLNVQAVLNGRVVQRGDDLTLFLSLVDAQTGKAVWGEQYNRKLADLVALQTDITRDVSQKLRARLSKADEKILTKNYTENAEAFQLYMKGRFYLIRGIMSESDKSISCFQQAIEADPNYALAYSGLADAYRARVVGGGDSPAEFMPKAKAAAEKAIEIDDTLAEGHAALGLIIFWYDWDWNAAENQYKRALQLDPNSADSLQYYAVFLSNTGRHAEALAKIKRARELDPLSLRINAVEGMLLLHAGQTDEAIARLQKTLELDPNYRLANSFVARAYIEKGMFAEAATATHKAKELAPDSWEINSFGAYALAKSGKLTEARAELDAMLKVSKTRYASPYGIALVYNGLGETEKTLDYLEKAFAEKDVRMVFLKVEPKWNNLRSEPRFIALMRRMNF